MSPIKIIEQANLTTRFTYRLDERPGGFGVAVYYCDDMTVGPRPDLRRSKHFPSESEARDYIIQLRQELPL